MNTQELPPAHAVAGDITTSRLALILGLVTAVQALVTFTVLALPTLAPLVAPALGFGPEIAGYQIGLVYAAAATLSSVSGLAVRRLGAATVTAFALVLAASGLAGIATGNVTIAALASVSIGIGYSLTNPAASHLIFRFAPRKHQNIVFALKQTGVPLGGVLAALLLPRLAEICGWQMALSGSALLVLLAVAPMLALRRTIDSDRQPNASLGAGGALSGLRLVLASRRLAALAIVGWSYGVLQFCLFTFFVTMVVTELGWSLVAAGGVATVMQIGGVSGRIAWSALADRLNSRGLEILAAIGLGSIALTLVVIGATPAWSPWLLGSIAFGLGFCLVGWNGLWLAEIARAAKPDEVGLATGGVLVFTYAGVVLGPAAFSSMYKAIGSYAFTYGLFSVFALVGIVALMWAKRRSVGVQRP